MNRRRRFSCPALFVGEGNPMGAGLGQSVSLFFSLYSMPLQG